MTMYVALLRGINVGGRTISMAGLKDALESLGLCDVWTVAQTGNVAFTSHHDAVRLKGEIEARLAEAFHYPAKAQVFTIDHLCELVAASPFAGDPDHHSYIVFFENGLEQQLAAEANELDSSIERIHVGKGVMYWWVVKGQTLKSRFAHYLTKPAYKDFHTNRNITTLRKIIA